ncbi:MAG: alpha-ketoacid dehydrogenase subunit beta [Synergistaceae bacterium]|jgi:pyruvate dehydrogenase E1 component beta subunit|nr:alpha-ketoacid dehydrogenase subunit beta [Synergistaceae bacterium]
MAMMSLVEALNSALAEEMRRDESVFCVGEDISDTNGGYGGAFAVTRGLAAKFGDHRVINTPISEILIAGLCVGAAMTGMRPVGDLQYGDFLFCMMDQLVNQAAKMCYMSNGAVKVPMVMRAPCGATTRGAQHAQSLEGFFTRVPGLKVVSPATPYDAKGLLKQAIRDDNPVIVFEHKRLYGGKRAELGALSITSDVPEEEYTVEFGKAAVRREGKDITVVANLLMQYRAQEAAAILEREGISMEIIDPRTLLPFDYDTVIGSLRKTGRLMIIHEDNYSGGWGAQVSAYIAEHEIYLLDAPICRVATYDVPIPFAPVMEDYAIPSTKRIVEEARALMLA